MQCSAVTPTASEVSQPTSDIVSKLKGETQHRGALSSREALDLVILMPI